MIDTSALREKVLDLAIRGKLVPQDPNDEPASVLLERIRAEKEQMVKDGKLKAKDIKNDTVIFKGEDNLHYEKFSDGTVKCIEDEIPFDVPDGWAWCRLGIVTSIFGRIGFRGYTKDDLVDSNNGAITLSPSNIISNKMNYDKCSFISWYKYEESPEIKIHNGDILLVKTGSSYGKSALVENLPKEATINPQFVVLKNTYISSEFLCYILQSSYAREIFDEFVVGTAIPTFTQANLSSMCIPIPTINQQKKITDAIKEIFDNISSLITFTTNLKNDIAICKSKILDLAIHGKLVPQDPNDEPASALLERIKAEKEELIKQGKIKRDKKESVIFKGEDNSYYEKIGDNIVCIDDEIPFEIPAEWRWERLGNISTIARGGSPRPINEYLTNQDNGINWIKIGDTEQGGKYIYSTKEKIIPEGLSKTRYVKSGDFLLTNSMSYGRPYILKTDGCIHDGWLVIADIENIFYQDFLYYALSSNEMYRTFTNLAAGSTVKNLKSDSVKSILFPIPPYDEQLRISNYIEEIYQKINIIEKSLS